MAKASKFECRKNKEVMFSKWITLNAAFVIDGGKKRRKILAITKNKLFN
jgi:hypothetical protein